MNAHLQQLIDISNLDKEIDSFLPRIEDAQKQLNDITRQRNRERAEQNEILEAVKDLSISIQKNENQLAELQQKLEEISQKTALVKTEKEAKALSLEDELAREQIGFANEEIARLGAMVESKKEAAKEKAEQIAELEKKIEEERKASQSAVSAVKAEQQQVLSKKEALVAKMDSKIIIFYEKVRRWAKNTSVVGVGRQACGGCFIRLNDKIYSEVLRGEDIMVCPHCGRILYPESAK